MNWNVQCCCSLSVAILAMFYMAFNCTAQSGERFISLISCNLHPSFDKKFCSNIVQAQYAGIRIETRGNISRFLSCLLHDTKKSCSDQLDDTNKACKWCSIPSNISHIFGKNNCIYSTYANCPSALQAYYLPLADLLNITAADSTESTTDIEIGKSVQFPTQLEQYNCLRHKNEEECKKDKTCSYCATQTIFRYHGYEGICFPSKYNNFNFSWCDLIENKFTMENIPKSMPVLTEKDFQRIKNLPYTESVESDEEVDNAEDIQGTKHDRETSDRKIQDVHLSHKISTIPPASSLDQIKNDKSKKRSDTSSTVNLKGVSVEGKSEDIGDDYNKKQQTDSLEEKNGLSWSANLEIIIAGAIWVLVGVVICGIGIKSCYS